MKNIQTYEEFLNEARIERGDFSNPNKEWVANRKKIQKEAQKFKFPSWFTKKLKGAMEEDYENIVDKLPNYLEGDSVESLSFDDLKDLVQEIQLNLDIDFAQPSPVEIIAKSIKENGLDKNISKKHYKDLWSWYDDEPRKMYFHWYADHKLEEPYDDLDHFMDNYLLDYSGMFSYKTIHRDLLKDLAKTFK